MLNKSISFSEEIHEEAAAHFRKVQDGNNFDDYKLPLGLKNKLISIIKNFKDSGINNNHQKVNRPKKVKNDGQHQVAKYSKRMLNLYNSLIRQDLQATDENMHLTCENGVFIVQCPICPSKIKVFETGRNQFNATNFKTHIKHRHADELKIEVLNTIGEQDESEQNELEEEQENELEDEQEDEQEEESEANAFLKNRTRKRRSVEPLRDPVNLRGAKKVSQTKK